MDKLSCLQFELHDDLQVSRLNLKLLTLVIILLVLSLLWPTSPSIEYDIMIRLTSQNFHTYVQTF